jgi:tetratricopeptide (TPR) repeat protein
MTEEEALSALRGDDPEAASRAEAALWRMWCQSGDPELDLMLLNGIEAVERRDLEGAARLFGEIVARAPGFTEAWNKRATVRYLAEDFRGSIADCAETLSRKPHHFGALSGQGLCHMALGQHREAAAMFRRALEVHPHLEAVRHNLRLALAEVVKGNGHG